MSVPANKSTSSKSCKDHEGHLLISRQHPQGVLELILNRPSQFNTLSHEMLDALQTSLDNMEPDIRVVVIGANGKAFCAGHDLKQMRDNPDEQWQKDLFNKCSHFMQSLLSIEQPVIAKVQGVAAAAGCQLVANCDLAVAAEQCSFGVSGINLGLFCSTPSVALSRNIGRKRAFQMLMTGDMIDAATAVEWGLLNDCVPAADLDATVDALCARICGKSRVAVSTGKKLFYEQAEQSLKDAYEIAGTAMACNMMSEDVAEGIDAFFDKRTPTWKHR